MTPASFSELIERITPEMYADLRRAVELGRFPDGHRLSREQQADLLHTLLAWEQKNLPEHLRTGAMEQKTCGSKTKNPDSASSTVGMFNPNDGQLP
jgi:uncharacterized protein YeaC (DUF1315 family)